MKTGMILAAVLLTTVVAAGTALAGGKEGTLGIGTELHLSGLGGLSATYDLGQFHMGGFLGFSDGGGDDDTDITIGGRFYYHMHSTAMSDFSVGGAIGLAVIGDRNPSIDDNLSEIFLEPGMQIRAFVVQNVALSFTGGLALAAGDAEGILLGGQLTGAAGVHYYFF